MSPGRTLGLKSCPHPLALVITNRTAHVFNQFKRVTGLFSGRSGFAGVDKLLVAQPFEKAAEQLKGGFNQPHGPFARP